LGENHRVETIDKQLEEVVATGVPGAVEGGGAVVQAEPTFRDETKDERHHEDLGHAPDAEAVLDRERLTGAQVGHAGCGLDALLGPDRQDRLGPVLRLTATLPTRR
jgi:hypothetical protein